MTIFWGLLALASLLPAIMVSWFSTEKNTSLMKRGTLLLALVGPSFVTLLYFGGHWDSGLSISIWVTISFSMVLFLCFSLLVQDFSKLAVLLLPYLFVLGVFALLWEGHNTHSALKAEPDFWLVLHIIASVITYALCTLAAISSFAVLLRERALKTKKMESRLLERLPAVYVADRFQVSLLTMAEVVLGLGILTGIARQYSSSGSLIDFDHKTLLALIAFVVIAVLLILHRYIGIRGQNAVRFVLATYLLMTLAYPGVKFVTDIVIG
ncbi:cytochrome C assembly family protein [Kiloniella antarctica]|uniref:Inner membrane protein YpjD n=1 Tax=Kiloniella antarctica TaxID=1550907 RepID=A0ABW5BMG3_9PROT